MTRLGPNRAEPRWSGSRPAPNADKARTEFLAGPREVGGCRDSLSFPVQAHLQHPQITIALVGWPFGMPVS